MFVKNYSFKTFLGRIAGEMDLKGVTVFLVSSASEYVTGQNLVGRRLDGVVNRCPFTGRTRGRFR